MPQNQSFISNVNALAEIIDSLNNINLNISFIKSANTNEPAIKKVVELEDDILHIKNNSSMLLLISNSMTKLNAISNSLDEIEKVNDNYDDFFVKYDEASRLVGKFRIQLDEFFSAFPEIQTMYQDIVLKNENINKNILKSFANASSSSTNAGVALAAKNAIEEKYQVYLEATTIEDEVVAVASIKNEIVALKNDLSKIVTVFENRANINTLVGFKNSIIDLANNIQDIKDAIAITTDAKNVTNQNVQITTADKNTIKQYKDETLNNRNITLNLKDLAVKTLADMTPIVNQINRQTSSNNKLAFQVHSIATRLSIEFSSVIAAIKKIQEEKELELDLFAENLTNNLALEIANAKTIVSKDVVTSQKIVSEISESLSLLTDAKHRENKNEIRFKNSELISLLAISKMMIENKVIDENTQNQILEFEIKLKEKEHETIKSILNNFTTNQRIEVLVAKSLLTDIKLQTL